MMKKATIKDVAREVGVSTATVSYVLNGKSDKVSPETIERINQAIERLNYIPDYSARSLVKNQSRLIGVVIPQTEAHRQLILENPFYSEVISGIESKLREHGYHLIMSGVDKGGSYLDLSIQRNLDGAIIMGIYQESFYEDLKKIKIPIVLIDSYVNDHYFKNIGIDDEYGGYLATQYLIGKGHTNIGLVTGEIRRDGVIEKRFLGYKKAMREANLFYNPDYVFEGSMSYEHGMKMGQLIAQKFPEITAVFATADMVAFGVIKSLMDEGKKVPEDVSVIGFDDISFSRMFYPSLTTVKQDIAGKGAMAGEQLLNLIQNGSAGESMEVTIPVRIVERESVRQKM